MQVLRHAPEVSAFIQTQPKSEISALIRRRLAELLADGDTMEELVFFVIPEADDSLAELEGVLCQPASTPEGHPLWEAIEAHDSCYEMVFVLSSSGYGALVLVPQLGTHPALLELCRSHTEPSPPPTTAAHQGGIFLPLNNGGTE